MKRRAAKKSVFSVGQHVHFSFGLSDDWEGEVLLVHPPVGVDQSRIIRIKTNDDFIVDVDESRVRAVAEGRTRYRLQPS